MPQGNGKGPFGQGGSGGYRGQGRMGGNRPGAGPSGNCICPNCGRRVPHQRGVPCYSMVCPDCKTKLVRE